MISNSHNGHFSWSFKWCFIIQPANLSLTGRLIQSVRRQQTETTIFIVIGDLDGIE